jgi:hypothetical protein
MSSHCISFTCYQRYAKEQSKQKNEEDIKLFLHGSRMQGLIEN